VELIFSEPEHYPPVNPQGESGVSFNGTLGYARYGRVSGKYSQIRIIKDSAEYATSPELSLAHEIGHTKIPWNPNAKNTSEETRDEIFAWGYALSHICPDKWQLDKVMLCLNTYAKDASEVVQREVAVFGEYLKIFQREWLRDNKKEINGK
jgi:hypothetical protein